MIKTNRGVDRGHVLSADHGLAPNVGPDPDRDVDHAHAASARGAHAPDPGTGDGDLGRDREPETDEGGDPVQGVVHAATNATATNIGGNKVAPSTGSQGTAQCTTTVRETADLLRSGLGTGLARAASRTISHATESVTGVASSREAPS